MKTSSTHPIIQTKKHLRNFLTMLSKPSSLCFVKTKEGGMAMLTPFLLLFIFIAGAKKKGETQYLAPSSLSSSL
jgi:hypothetical protein